MIQITPYIAIKDHEVLLTPIRAQGAGGQNVNKVSSAIHLRFDIKHSALPSVYKERLLALADSRISKEGVIIIKAQMHRTQEKNKLEACERLKKLVCSVTTTAKPRRATKPSKSSQRKRLDKKTQRGKTKSLRQSKNFD